MGNQIRTTTGRERNEIVQYVVGEKIDIDLPVKNDEGVVIVYRSSRDLIKDTIDDVFSRLGIDYDTERNLANLSHMVVEACLGRLLKTDGFQISYGGFTDPRRIVNVDLMAAPVIMEAAVVTDIAPGAEAMNG